MKFNPQYYVLNKIAALECVDPNTGHSNYGTNQISKKSKSGILNVPHSNGSPVIKWW